MTAFRRFDPYAILAKADREPQTLAALAGLAEATVEIENDASASVISVSNPANESQNHGGTPAKGANPAKVDRDEAGVLATSTPALEILDQWGEAEEQRAAIIEYDGGIPHT